MTVVDSNHSSAAVTRRSARVAIGAAYVAIALTGARLQAGGFSGLPSLLGAISWVLIAGLVITSAVGIYLMIVRRPTRRGWYASLALMLFLVVLDLVVLSPRSPLRVPSAIGHAGLAALLFALFGWRWNAASGVSPVERATGG